MKKTLILICIIVISLTISGCSLSGNEMYTCTTDVTNTSGLSLKTTYDIEYKDDVVKKVKIIYDYNQEDNMTNDVNDNNVSTNIIDNNMDGFNADTDGNSDSDNNEIVDGITGDVIDGIVDIVTDTIIDISGVKERHNIVSNRYGTIDGLTITTDDESDNHYKVIYEIDMEKISDSDLEAFNIDRNFTKLKDNYDLQGLTCK